MSYDATLYGIISYHIMMCTLRPGSGDVAPDRQPRRLADTSFVLFVGGQRLNVGNWCLPRLHIMCIYIYIYIRVYICYRERESE